MAGSGVGQRGSDTIVLHLGSKNLRFEFAHEMAPQVMPNVIAYPSTTPLQVTTPQCDTEALHKASKIVQDYLISLGCIQDSQTKLVLPKKQVKGRVGSGAGSAAPYFEEEEPILDVEIGPEFSWTNPDHVGTAGCLVGDMALNLPDGAGWVQLWPILRGYFNLASGISFQGIANSIQHIIEYAIVNRLGVLREQFGNYNVILVIPDLFQRDQVKALTNVLLRNLGFRGIFLQQKSVSALFGFGNPSACVVDIGAEHVSVTCVDEGVLLPTTVVHQHIGGNDIDLLLMKLLRPDAVNGNEIRYIEALKTNACRLIQLEQEFRFHWTYNGTDVMTIPSSTIHLTVAAHSLFHPQLLEIVNPLPKALPQTPEWLEYDIEDNLEDMCDFKREFHSPTITKSVGIDQLIVRSVGLIPTIDVKKKMAANVLVIGGGAQFVDLTDVLQNKLRQAWPQNEIDKVVVRSCIEHNDADGNKQQILPPDLVWVGASVITKLDSARDLWITRSRWVGEWDAFEAKEEMRLKFSGGDETTEQISEICRKWRKDRPLEGGSRHLKEKSTFFF